MKRYDTIEVVEKNVVEVTEVEKFNPFHDSRGRFSNKNGFKSYSANPNTKAGAMAIARSAAAGHGNTQNVHSQSYGENIRQNANWLGRGKQVKPGQQGNATLRQRVEPITGLSGASAVGSSWQYQNQQQGRTTQPGKQPQQKPQQAATAAPKQQATQTQAQNQNAAQKPQQKPQKPANDRQPVDGKDISKTFQYDQNKKGSALDQVAEQQGFKGKPTLVTDSAEFSAAVKDSGFMAYRTWGKGTDVVTGKTKTAAEFADDLKNADNFSHNGTGGQAYGSGIYIASTQNPMKGKAPSRHDTNSAKNDSSGYGFGDPNKKTVGMTLAKDAKIGDYNTLYAEWNKMRASEHRKFGRDLGAFIASKGYDAVRAVGAGWGCDYTVVYNRTKLIIYDG